MSLKNATSEMELPLLFLAILISIVMRYCVGLWGHSGKGQPIQYGDFEAQRHWLEITNNIPIG